MNDPIMPLDVRIDPEDMEDFLRSWYGAVPDRRLAKIVKTERSERWTKTNPKRLIPIVLATLECGAVVEFNGKDWDRRATPRINDDCPIFSEINLQRRHIPQEAINAACDYCRFWPLSEGWEL